MKKIRIGKIEKIILCLLEETPGLSSREISDEINRTETETSRILERMEYKNLINKDNTIKGRKK